jgi:signal transduction histidine kinase
LSRIKKSRSIAFRLIAAVLAVELLSSVLVCILSYGYECHIHFHAFDTMLHGRVDSVIGAVQDAGDEDDTVMLDKADLHLPKDDIYEVYNEKGEVLGRSSNWQGINGAPTLAPHEHDRYSGMSVNSREYRMLVRRGSRIVDPGDPGGGKRRRVMVVYGAPTEGLWHAIHAAVEFYAIGSILLLAVTGPLMAWLLHRGLLPLRQLATLASQVSADFWHFSPPASARTTPELAPLTHAMENVLQRLERSFTQQRTFVSDAAHELKTAVAVVKSSLQLLGLRQRTPAEYQAGLERSLADTQRLEDLVAKMLTLARVEDGSPSPRAPAAADLGQCVRQAVAELETVAELHRIQVGIEIAANSPGNVPLTQEECYLLLSNLLLNALQHNPPESNVQVRATINHAQNSAEFSVQDHGEGIDPADLPHVFDRFYRSDPSRARSTGGAGLGLAICKAVVERAGGSIAISSQLGLGTTVTVSLPLALNSIPQSLTASA